MKLYLGEVESDYKKRQIFLYTGMKGAIQEQEIILEKKDFDMKWLNYIVQSAIEDEGEISYPDAENRFYIQLYILFSLRRRLYYSDICNLMNIGYESEDLLYHHEVQAYLWERLCMFMNTHEYQFKVIKSTAVLYEERPYVPLRKYHVVDFLSKSGIRMLWLIVKRLTVRYSLYYEAVMNEKVCKNSVERILNMKYFDVKHIKFRSQSGCLFFSAESMDKGKLFIKVGTVQGADIENEYNICKYLNNNTKNKHLYLLPYIDESARDKLVFPFVDGCALKSVITHRQLSANEVRNLLFFLDSVLTDLSECKIVHRDIHLDNILCKIDSKTNEISAFILSDFGCAVIDNARILNDSIRQKRKNQYAGSFYRYSRYTWDDAAAAAYVVMQNISVDMIDHDLEKKLLSCIGRNFYSLEYQLN